MLIHFYRFVDKLKNNPARRDKRIYLPAIISLVINLLLWGFLYFQFNKILNASPGTTTLPLHYNVFFGIDLYAKWYRIFVLPGIGLLILSFNFVIAQLIYSHKQILSYFLILTALICQLALVTAGFLIVIINL